LRDVNERDLLLLYKDRFNPDNPLFGATLDSYKVMEDYIFKSVCLGDEAIINFRNKNFDLFHNEESTQKLYLILDKSYIDYPVIKIGVSKNPSKRLISLRGKHRKTNSWQTRKSGSNLKLVCIFDGLNGLDEIILHNLLSSKRLLRPDDRQRTEYFCLSHSDIECIVHYAGLFGVKPHWFRNDLKQILSVDFKKPNFEEMTRNQSNTGNSSKKETEKERKDRLYRSKHLKAFLNRNKKPKSEPKNWNKCPISIEGKNGLHVFKGGEYDGQFVNPKSTSGRLDSVEKYKYLKFVEKQDLSRNKKTRRLLKHYLKFKRPKTR
jgi:hypothetical protein